MDLTKGINFFKGFLKGLKEGVSSKDFASSTQIRLILRLKIGGELIREELLLIEGGFYFTQGVSLLKRGPPTRFRQRKEWVIPLGVWRD